MKNHIIISILYIIYINLMSVIKTVAIVSLLLSIVCCEFGFRTARLHSTAQYQCLSKSKYKYAAISVNSSKTGITNEQVQNFAQAKNSGINGSALFTPCRNRNFSHDAYDFSQKIPRWTFNGTVYISISNLDSDSCKWDKNSQLLNCQYLTNIIQELRNYYLQVGVAISDLVYKEYLINGKC